MREIKYRIWSVDREKYVQDEDWYYLSDEGELWNIYSHYYEMNKDFCVPELHIVEQYTGLKDKSGKEIYEGDVVKSELGNIGIVEFHHGQFVVRQSKLRWHSLNNHMPCKTIGNIHDNPELLEVAE